MNFQELVSLYFERSNAMQTYWGFYITIVIGLLAFFGTIKASPQKRILAILVSIGFAGFAYVNGDAIRDVVKTRSVTQQLILTYKDCDPTKQADIDKIGKTIRTADVRWVMGFHIASDLGVLAAIWVLTLNERMPKSKQA